MIIASPAGAQSNPVDVARSAFSAFDRRDWMTIVRMTDPEWIAKFREKQLAMLVVWAQSREESAQAKRAGVTFAFSSDGVLRAEDLAKVGAVRVKAFSGSPTIASLAALSAPTFFTRWLGAVHGRGGPPADTERRIFGSVLEAETLAHVIYRPMGQQYMDAWSVEVLALRRAGDRWLLLPNREIAWAVDLMGLLHEP